MSDLQRYVNDNALRVCNFYRHFFWFNLIGLVFLLQIFGLSDKAIVDYVIASGRQARAIHTRHTDHNYCSTSFVL